MLKMKKVIGLILSAILLMGTFTACKSKESTLSDNSLTENENSSCLSSENTTVVTENESGKLAGGKMKAQPILPKRLFPGNQKPTQPQAKLHPPETILLPIASATLQPSRIPAAVKKPRMSLKTKLKQELTKPMYSV